MDIIKRPKLISSEPKSDQRRQGMGDFSARPPEKYPLPKNREFPQGLDRKNKSRKKFWWMLGSLLLLLALAVSYFSFFAYKLSGLAKKVNPTSQTGDSFIRTIQNLATHNYPKLKGEENGRINVLLLGVAGEKKPGSFLTDTIMIASINTNTNQVALMSLPRDLYVKVPAYNLETKINSVYPTILKNESDYKKAAGVLEETIQNITGQKINYFVVLDFDGFKKVIDAIGGINIINERDIYDTHYPGPSYSYETFELKKGFHQMDGATALKYARERHDDPEGDFGRAKRQQQVMQSTKNKIFSAKTFLDVFALNNLFNALGDNIKTDIGNNEIGAFLELAKRLDTNNINNVVVDAWNNESLLKVSHVFYGETRAFVLIPRVGNYSEIQELAQNVFDLNKIRRRKEEISKEKAEIAILNQSQDNRLPQKIKRLLSENWSYENVSVLPGIEVLENSPQETFVFDFTSGQKPFSLDELITRLPAKLGENKNFDLSAQKLKKNPDLLIVIGKDLKNVYNMEEDSIEDWKKSQDNQAFENIEN